MKTLCTLVISFLLVQSSIAQNDWSRNSVNLRVGPEVGFAIGDLNKTHGAGVGASALLDVPVLSRVSLIFYVGTISFAGDKISGSSSTKYTRTNVYPLRTGINYKFTNNLYGGVQVGQSSVKYLGVKDGGFSQSFGVGYFNRAIDLGLRWDHNYAHGGLGSINFKAAYVISFRRDR